MRGILVSAILGLNILSAPVYAVPDWVIPSPITIVLQVGKWLIDNNNQELYQVRVQAKGSTESEARTEAFKLAVDEAVGSLLVSETKIQDGNVKQHDVINYSSGYIHNFEYVNIHRDSSGVTLQVDVWVAGSEIANRLGVTPSATGELKGGKIAESFRSLKQENVSGDKILQNVLNDFPEKALDVKIENIDYTYNNRTPVLNLTMLIWWKKSYTVAFEETVSQLGKSYSVFNKHSKGATVKKERCLFCSDKHYALDQARTNIVWNGIDRKQPNVLVNILDANGNSVYKSCWTWENLTGNQFKGNLFTSDMINTTIYPDRMLKNNLSINLENFSVERMDKVELSILRANRCP